MIENLPAYISIAFLATTLLTLILFYWVLRHSDAKSIRKNATKIMLAIVIWLSLQAVLSIKQVYSQDLNAIPPKIFIFGILPNILLIGGLFLSERGRTFIDSLSIEKLTYLHLVRIPVEFVLLWLFLNSTIPEIMTFEGWNFDIVMGITAPLVIYFGFVKGKMNVNTILVWNVVGILLLSFIFIIAILSAPFPLQQLAFEQPNTGLLYFPFSWLPTFIVPIVMLGHFISIRQLLKSKLA